MRSAREGRRLEARRLYVKTRAHVKECVAPARDATRAGVMNEVANAARGHLQECAA
jgi:hypothetical protein